MTVLLAGAGLLFLSFCAQLVLWRIFVPGRQIRALLIVFFIVPFIAFGLVQIIGAPAVLLALSAAEIVRLAIFYGSCALAYIVLYSAIEEQSPTLAIMSYVASRPRCADADLVDKFGRGHELSHRVELLARSKFVRQEGDRYLLAPAGHRFAKLFDAANRLFGLGSGDERLRAEWLLTFAPIIGLATNCLAHIICRKVIGLRINYALACGFLSGLAVTAAVALAKMPAMLSAADTAAVWSTLVLTYVALAFGFWAFLNLNMTSLRIRMLRELLHSDQGMARAELLDRYSPEEFLRRRLVRLERSKDLALVDGRYSLGSRKLLYVDRCLKALRAVIFAGTFRKQDG